MRFMPTSSCTLSHVRAIRVPKICCVTSTSRPTCLATSGSAYHLMDLCCSSITLLMMDCNSSSAWRGSPRLKHASTLSGSSPLCFTVPTRPKTSLSPAVQITRAPTGKRSDSAHGPRESGASSARTRCRRRHSLADLKRYCSRPSSSMYESSTALTSTIGCCSSLRPPKCHCRACQAAASSGDAPSSKSRTSPRCRHSRASSST
mmetsp:Transcript_57067/g.161099  ORF Transcript_57067/g.161099 Transcript_57067/m.161099 type:complete len:204 (-) Transcript_57067:1927-2538(-)